MGHGYTKTTDPIVAESSLPKESLIDKNAEIWSVRKDGAEVLDAVFNGDKWMRVQ